MGSHVFSQTFYFDNYGVAEGLYQSKVTDILQDKEHNIWLGTQGGASRFDGKEFLNFTSQNGLAQNGVQVLFRDSREIIWFGHLGGGISILRDKKPEVFIQSGATIKSDIMDIAEDKLHRIWIATYGSGAFCFTYSNSNHEKIQYEQFKGNKLSDRIFYISTGYDSSLYFVTDVGIKKFNEKLQTFENFQPEGLTQYFAKTCMFEDSKKNWWFGTYHGGLYRQDGKTGKFKIYDIRDGLASNWITSIKEDSQGNIWLGSWGNGLTRIKTDGKINVFNTSNGLQDDKVGCIFEDAEGNILIGTNEHGLSIYKGELFVSYKEKDGIANPQIWAITQDIKGRYWFGTNGGISIYDPGREKSRQFVYYNQENKNISNQVRFLGKDKQNDIWIGTLDQGVIRFQIENNRFIYEPAINTNISNNSSVTAMVVDKSNNVWTGTSDGLIRYNITKKEVTRLTQTDGLLGNEISSLFVKSDNEIIVGIIGKGINIIKDTNIRSYILGQGISPNCIAEDKLGKIWIGTKGQGVMVFDGKRVIHQFTEQDGLLANLINLLVCGDDNSIFIGTNKGLNRYSPKENKMYSYTRKNGFTGIETKDNAVYKDAASKIWFGTVDGAMCYNPAQVLVKKPQPLTHITRFRINLEDVAIKKGIKLNYKENGIIFDYHSICLTNPEAVRYQIMLEGADKVWQPPTEQTSVTYSALPPNKYTFKVKARNSDGVWNEEPESFSFIINPPFYFTWWFITFCIIAILISIFLYIQIREKNLIAEKHILEEKVKERTVEVTMKNEELAEKNKNITDSIRYAKRIQFAILPPDVPYEKAFILFKPKDIVSGDFYWIHTDGDLEFLAAVDCTGHGVPGAFMSIIGHILLNKIVKEYKILKPSEILNKLNKELTETLHSKGESTNVADGMDLSLVCFNSKKNTLEFAGAYNSLFLIRDGKLIEYPANRFSIGRNTGPDNEFSNHEVSILPDDMIFLCSDGFEDQFGGINGKKFKRKSLNELFVSIANLDAQLQKETLDKVFEQWRSELEQIDDVLVIGRKF
jgi:ligand-binding sensor domain-containing protein/serine phosphatase RsbU (regulator of sigma subunit)